MSRVHQIQLSCEIDPHRESIHGEMSDQKGKSLPFNGWTEFASALVALTSAKGVEKVDGSRAREVTSADDEVA